ncbi:hypothetical protein LCI18_015238 [Fusarium solani-melongenae]|uniref:Uncharacterized protein n=1 Tax=Fusarium solani subsp. cucurbitae TaxID=2747967 RepID=A0ACD3ZSJ2_FUSSC|nr:hypothetical protein LCI18_015238 [Fusarium solani-melongenae]
MSYVTEATTWLSDNLSQDVKTLIARFYELADSKQSDVGHIMATEIFTKDAVLANPNGTHRGNIKEQRQRLESRHIKKAYRLQSIRWQWRIPRTGPPWICAYRAYKWEKRHLSIC